MPDVVQIDGSFGEGGGQIIRTALSLAAMTNRAVEIFNVRGRRTKPGLQPQHLAAVRAAAELCNARLAGDSIGSQFLSFEPQSAVVAGDYQSAGVSTVRVTGGTHVPHSPPVEYLEAVYIPALRRAGLDVTLGYSAAGFFPRGGGQIELEIHGAMTPTPVDLSNRGRLEELRAFVITSNLPDHVAERGAATVAQAMRAVGRNVTIERRAKPSSGPGAAVILAAQCEAGLAGFTAVGELRRPMEKVAEAPCKEFMRWWKSGAACDEHLADQLVLPLAFATGRSRWTTPVVTEHLRTVLWVAGQFLPLEVVLQEAEDGTAVIELEGARA